MSLPSKPLEGLKVVEIGHSVAAPFAGMILAELGAEVVKIESPNGDYARGWGPPFWNGSAPHFVALNRSKSNWVVDFKNLVQLNELRSFIVNEADALILNLRAGVAEKYNLGSDSLLKDNPDLIYSEIGAFGPVGPLADQPGYDPLMQAYSGLMSITGENVDRPPIRVGVSVIDMGAGFWSVIGILSALLGKARNKSGGGAVNTSLFETALSWCSIPIASYNIKPRTMKPHGSGASGIVPYQAFKAEDGWLVIAAGNDKLFIKLCEAFEKPEWKRDERFLNNASRVENREAINALISEQVSRFSVKDLREILEKFGIPNAPVNRIDQIVDDPQTRALGIIQEGPDGSVPLVGLPLRFDGIRPEYTSEAPTLSIKEAGSI